MDANKTTILLGPPGTGKTTRLIAITEELLAKSPPDKICFLSFTRKAAENARQRAMKKFGLNEKQLPYFRTVHSLALRLSKVSRNRIMQRRHWLDFGEKLGVDLSDVTFADDSLYGMTRGQRLVFLDNLARTTQRPLVEVWEQSRAEDIAFPELQQFADAVRLYKEGRGLLDFTDLLYVFVSRGFVPEFDALLVDEAQDLSAAQWDVIELLSKRSKQCFFAGDDLQAIFRWAGADVERFIDLPGRVEVLGQSYRVPKAPQELALRVAGRVGKRRQAAWSPRPEAGSVTWHADPTHVDMSHGKWLVMCRNGYMLQELEELCLTNGWSFDSVRWSPLRGESLAAVRAWEALRAGRSVPGSTAALVARFLRGNIDRTAGKRLMALNASDVVDIGNLERWYGLATQSIWHEALEGLPAREREYFLAARKQGEKLLGEPRISLSTIHSAKGLESPNVLLLTDISRRSESETEIFPDDEHRVFYVGLTRVSEALHIVHPQTACSYQV